MKRFLFLFMLALIAVCCYLGYSGSFNRLYLLARQSLMGDDKPDQESDNGPSSPTVQLKPVAFTSYHKKDIEILNNPEADTEDKVKSWQALSTVYLNPRAQAFEREMVLDPMTNFVNLYILSSRMPDNPAIGRRHIIQRGQTLSGIAKASGTTVEAIKKLNNLTSNTILPNNSLKIMSQKTAVFVSKSGFRLWVTYGGNFLLAMDCGIGKNNSTPVGHFVINVKEVNPKWWKSNNTVIPAGNPDNELGSRWMGFKDNRLANGLGIHEAVNGVGIGEAKSNGCIRLMRPDVEKLYDLIPLGTTVTIVK